VLERTAAKQTSNATLRFATAQLATGPQLHYAAQGDGEAIVFLHGWPDSWFSFSRLLAFLPQHYRAFALDQRGFGDSERPAAGYGIAGLAADVRAFLDAVGIERATVVGHSFGSFVARRFALDYPERAARLVLIGSAFSVLNPVTRDVQTALRELPDPVPAAFAREFQASTAYVPLPEAFFERIIFESMKLPARLWREVLDNLLAYEDAAQLARIVAPTLIMWGNRDALFARADQERLVAAIPGATLKIYPDTGHCPNWERPESVAADLSAFMAEPAYSGSSGKIGRFSFA
jgi:non-heme chloroperoxidase